MYNNNFNGDFRGHQFRQGRTDYGRVPYRQNVQPIKRSGATYSKIKKGQFEGGTIVSAWNVSKSRGVIVATVAPYKKSGEKVYNKEKTKTYRKMIASVTFLRTGQKLVLPVLMNEATQVITIKELGMVISPKGSGVTKKGKRVSGYFGTYQR